ncbi:hypothetical protein ABLE91_06585 [Aquabacter sp. CN5-332]|uniref:hypothetical protein n=1 Tax=Aquabacter sp. CN5-332 TaxID=3156608 RepID=UPI0032B55CC0
MTTRRGNPPGHSRRTKGSFQSSIILYTTCVISFCVLFKEITGSQTLLYVGALNFSIHDVIFLSTVACLIALLKKIKLNAISLIIIALVAITLAGFLRGLLVSPYDAVFALRSTGAFIVLLVISVLLPDEGRIFADIRRVVIVSSIILASLVALRSIFGASLFITDDIIREVDINDGGRALTSAGALWLAFGGIFAAERAIAPRQGPHVRLNYGIILLVLCVALVASGQGTANAAGLLSILLVLAIAPGPSRELRVAAIGTMTLLGLVIVTASDLLTYDSLEHLLPSGMENWLLRRSANLETRQEIWAGLMVDFDSWPWISQYFGLPMGERPTIFISLWGGIYWELGVHSMYYGYLAVAGLVGVTLYVLLLGLTAFGNLTRLKKTPSNPYLPGPSVGLALTMMCAVFGYSYDLRNEQGLMLALAIASSTKSAPSRRMLQPVGPKRAGDLLPSRMKAAMPETADVRSRFGRGEVS